MTSNAIHFGTSGWRGIIAEDFTFGGVRIAAAAIADHVRSHTKNPTLLVGYDTRFFSEEFARAAAAVLTAEGCRVLLCAQPTPTPAIAFEILRRKLQGAINITASHNPAAYNGLKFSGPDGAPALPEATRDIEARASKLSNREWKAPAHNAAQEFEMADLHEAYLARLGELVRFDVIASSQLSFAYDALHGCGAGWLDAVLEHHGIQVHSIRTARDVLFDGSGPDPSEENLKPLVQAIAETKASVGLATDGDADRFGIVDRDGSFISPNHILALVFDYLIESRGWKLGVARSVATTHLLDAVARHYDVPVFETPVGFKYIGPFLERDKITLGGEESAGMTIRGHVPEKDGILACLLVAEMIAARRESVGEQLQDLFRRVGRAYWPIRVNLHLAPGIIAGLAKTFASTSFKFAERRIARTDRTDGLKLIFDDESWVLLRPSGTEPLVRVYAESQSLAESAKIAEDARQWVTA
ncbi:MAG TPA: phosphoglucomutase/phosphomannomutase family protein [Candidatus Limnocylindrales bacterium]|nr:phosphoglucomutase/phosphomannomutase family protein [Candidatus Limnocylindrales bacterium]